MSGWKRGEQLLTPEEKLAIEVELLEEEVTICLHGWYGRAKGKETKLARAYGVSRQRINQIKRGLCATQLFYHRQRRGFLGQVADGRFFLVDSAVWKRSIHESITMERMTRERAIRLNLEPEHWEPCIGTAGVRYLAD